jgi:hypothetical protein
MIFTNNNGILFKLFSIKTDYTNNTQIKNREYAYSGRNAILNKRYNTTYLSYNMITELQNKKTSCNSCNGAK